MKTIITALLLCYSVSISAQCTDIYSSKVDCPTEEDSLVLYNNAIKVVQFYDSNRSYQLTNSIELETVKQKRDVFEQLKEARRMFNIIRREIANLSESEKKFSAGKPRTGYKDISYSDYYQEVDEYRFYQRELENQIINANAQIPIYDSRIAPILVNTYQNSDSASVYFGDLVQIPLYVPVVVKPFALLTGPELMLRNKVLKIPAPKVYPTRSMVKRDSIEPKVLYVRNDTIQQPVNSFFAYREQKLPVYYYNQYGSACVIGFMIGHKFKKLTYEEYNQYAVTPFARTLLADDLLLDKQLRIKFGAYYEGLLQ
ncbi:hypothetical protein UFOVP778_30 [uncultured Caudovirales phage]|uniref:Uncharacterized protein n=1 Tax=uncultured Caudovirales phage TaxID=2100421 RepID=A0A6J5NSZ3_9CAUD|nr:hypothetical protein UFOVP778_30 [uncultured Caudovirales phage]